MEPIIIGKGSGPNSANNRSSWITVRRIILGSIVILHPSFDCSMHRDLFATRVLVLWVTIVFLLEGVFASTVCYNSLTRR